ncbi:MAG: recombinase zinc beta ribbon domain-containing protein, partial [Phycisphaeraceae bacterium]|nr:recombinase zinc beta ribbon domain-containing protein [Phycisphaeraceae bacterium]
FAQFEREIISERTRDKIAAARRKGKWTGGHPVLGYDVMRDVRGTRLVVNEPEAQRVREVFARHIKVGSILATVKWLNAQGWRNKSFTTAGGKVSGGKEFDKATLFKLLTNVIYLGKITYGGQAYAGEHPAIVDEDLFGRVQGLLAHNRCNGGKHPRNKYGALLKGLVRCKHCGCGMMHHYTVKKGRRYRYYVCMNAQKRGWSSCPYPSLPAGDLERFVVEQIRGVCGNPQLLKEVVQQAVEQIERQMDSTRQARARHESCVRRINEELCQLARTPQAPGVSAKLVRLQEDLQKAEALLLESNRHIAALEQRKVDEDELTGAFEAFDPMWDRMRPDERARLIHLLVQCVEYDGQQEELTIAYHPGGFDAVRPMEVTA